MSFINHFIASERNRQGISLARLSSGLCYFTAIHKIENGHRYADKLLYDTILQRLGISEEYFETYVSDDEHILQQLRSGIVTAIKNSDNVKVDELINKYYKLADFKNSLHVQYLKYTDIFKKEISCESPLRLAEMYRNLLCITVPNFEKVQYNELLLSDLEVFYIVKYILYLLEYDIEKAFCVGNNLCKYFEKLNQKSTAKLRCYGILTLSLSRILIDRYEFSQAYKLCNECIEELRKADIFYNLLGLINLKLEIMIKREEKNEEYEKFLTWAETLEDLYNQYKVNPDSIADLDYNSFSWKSYFVISDVIRIRRQMLDISQEELCEGICDVKTISRIENKKTRIHPRNAEKLLSRLNLTGELYSDNIVNMDIGLHNLSLETTGFIEKNEWEKARENMEIIKRKLNSENVINKQYIEHKKLVLQRRFKEIDNDVYLKKTKDTLALTIKLPIEKDINLNLTKKEIVLICNIIDCLGKRKNYNEMYNWIDILISYFEQKNYSLIHFTMYDFFYRVYHSLLGDIGEFDKSNDIANSLIYNEFVYGITNGVTLLFFGKSWNYKAEQIKNII